MKRLNANDIAGLGGPSVVAAGSVNYFSHPLLDPAFTTNRSRLMRFLEMTRDRIKENDEAYARESGRFFQAVGRRGSMPDAIARTSEYLREADVYLYELIDLLPNETHGYLQPDFNVADCNDVRDLLNLMLSDQPPRVRFEAQRKLCLATLLVSIDQSRHIQDGQEHKIYFEELLQSILWQHTKQVHELEIGFHIDEDGDTIHYTSRPGEGDQRWNFHSMFVEKLVDGRPLDLDILYYSTRFKRTVDPVSFHVKDGKRQVTEKIRWEQMRSQSNGSILSKMIRKGINNADEISDLLGAMFIVNDEDSLNDLLALLDESIGDPFGWRNVTDTLARETDRTTLNPHSGRGFKVFKGDMDVVYDPAEKTRSPYRFQVEIQIYTLEGFLRTVCSQHSASHHALKQRQFLYGLVPKIFPESIYGGNWLRLE